MSLYFAEGLPYMMIVVVSTIMYKNLGVSNSDIAYYTGLFYLPWVIKPFWSPFIDRYKTTKFWIIGTQFIIGILLALIGLTLPMEGYFKWSLIFMWLIAFSSSSHDIAADGYYIQALNSHQQSIYVGFRSLFYRLAMIAAQGGVVAWVGHLHTSGMDMHQSWKIAMIGLGAFFMLCALYHQVTIRNIRTTTDRKENIAREIVDTIISFFQKKGIIPAVLFILLYRLGEAQLGKMSTPFLLDSLEKGGLGLNNEQVGLAYGTIGIIGLIIGGISGGFIAAKHGLKAWIWPMAIAMNLPDVIYVFLAQYQPTNLWLIQVSIFIEQLGYGFGFTAFMLYLLSLSKGKHSTAHYAFATGIMALGMMIPSMISGSMQESLGYQNFFIWVTICTLPGFAIIPFLKIDKSFGKKTA